jgi:hypothetical protein
MNNNITFLFSEIDNNNKTNIEQLMNEFNNIKCDVSLNNPIKVNLNDLIQQWKIELKKKQKKTRNKK